MPDPNPNPTPPANNPPPGPDYAKEIEALKTRNAELDKQISELTKKPDPKPEDKDLLEKARLQREADDKKSSDSRALEKAITFNLKAKEFLSTNESLLPKGVADIFTEAEKENYSNAVEKDNAIKAGIVQSFFSVQTNVDLLTPGLKSSLDEYLKLTKTGKQDKAQSVYDGIFEPAFEMLKRIKKAEALSKGYGSEGDADTAYKNKMIKLSKAHYLGEK
jgi:hypothetical protein